MLWLLVASPASSPFPLPARYPHTISISVARSFTYTHTHTHPTQPPQSFAIRQFSFALLHNMYYDHCKK